MKLSNVVKAALLAVVGLVTLGLVSTPVVASTATTTFTVSAQVVATCTIAATNLSFGNYTGVVNTATSTITAQCTNTTPYNIGLNAGNASGATVTTRAMQNGTTLLGYSLYSDSGRTINWGNTVGTDTVSKTADGAADALTVYGQIPAGEYVAPGAYSDTITATITW